MCSSNPVFDQSVGSLKRLLFAPFRRNQTIRVPPNPGHSLPGRLQRQQKTQKRAMVTTVRAEMAKLKGRDNLDPVERIGNDLAQMQLQMRLA